MIIKIIEISLKVYREIASRCSRDNERRFLSSYVSVVQADTTLIIWCSILRSISDFDKRSESVEQLIVIN